MTTTDSTPFSEGPEPGFSQERPLTPDPGAPLGGPAAAGLYDPAHEHDACGVGFVVDIKGRRSHTIVEQGLRILVNLLHRGACGCEAATGDGAGILVQMPDRFLRKVDCAARLHAAGRRRLRRRVRLPPACGSGPRRDPRAVRVDRPRRRPAGARLADRADRRSAARRVGRRGRAAIRADFHRRRQRA